MAFSRNHGTCCLILPLKLGVGLTAMLVFVHSMVCILALLTSDVRFQQTGYNTHFYYLPAVAGSFGLIFGFLGLLGAYDDKWHYLQWFNRFFAVMLSTMFVSILADFATLQGCDSFKHLPGAASSNPQLYALSEASVCPWARWSYVVGCAVDFGVWLYLFGRSYLYEEQVRASPAYAIDFGREKFDVHSRWDFYKVKDPRKDRPPQLRESQEEDPFSYYGAVQQQQQQEQAALYGPDHMRIQGPGPESPGGVV